MVRVANRDNGDTTMATPIATIDSKTLWWEFRLCFTEGWGDTMHWWFTVADELYFRGVSLPAEWKFRPSPLGPSNEPDDYATNIVSECDDALLLRFGRALSRYARILKAAGLDY
jgi:hypothetical protein